MPERHGRIAPVTYVVRNEFGSHVAFFPGLIRGEFHFARVADIASVAEWPASRVVPTSAGASPTGCCWRTTWGSGASGCGSWTRSRTLFAELDRASGA